ncbi:MAG: hypothetical protein SGJ20_07775 [Planctomycetota bacterium]|nr:hypothetical protein [Planctomycetota bacterium]
MILTSSSIWWHKDESDLGMMNTVSRSLARYEFAYPDSLPNLRNDGDLVVTSDYGGAHRGAAYETMGVLLAGGASVGRWALRQKELRSAYLPDGRRLSYKGLNDRLKHDALLPFLDCANSLNGVILAILVDKQLGSLFSSTGRLDRDKLEFASLKTWRTATIERMLRVVHFISVLLRGLSSSGQNVIWLSDHDDIAANHKRLVELVACFKNISSHYLPHDLGHCRVGTAASDDGSRQVEDLVALPDLVVGALGDALPLLVRSGMLSAPRIAVPSPLGLKAKAQRVMNWFADSRWPLKRIVLVFDYMPESATCRITSLRMDGSHELNMTNTA